MEDVGEEFENSWFVMGPDPCKPLLYTDGIFRESP